jgi:hypothetical protein
MVVTDLPLPLLLFSVLLVLVEPIFKALTSSTTACFAIFLFRQFCLFLGQLGPELELVLEPILEF